MDSNTIKKSKEALRKAEENYQILEETDYLFSLKERFDLSCAILNHVTNYNNLVELCKEDDECSKRRETLLTNIQIFQRNLIESKANVPFEIDIDDRFNVIDFKCAAKTLEQMASEELVRGFINESKSCISTTIPEISKHKKTLTGVVERIKGEVYNVLIMGEYQSGKTTLINSIIGKYVGAIGNGTATSAVPISYTYGSEEKISVVWKSKERLLGILSILGRYIKDANLDNFDIDNYKDRETLLDKLNSFRRNDKECPTSGEAGCKSLAICSLILKHYGTEEFQDVISGDYSFDDIPILTRFPKNDESGFQTYWRKRGESKFNLKISLFAFIERIDCHIPSSRLQELNCTIIDAPGLFSNDYDTQVTEKEMERADAILYLLPYDKEAGEKSCGSLYQIKKKYPDNTRKLFIVNNRNTSDRKKNFVNSNRATVQEMFDDKIDLHVLDAHLAWLGVIKEAYENGNLTKSFKSEFIRLVSDCEYEEANLDAAFCEAFEDELYPYRLPHNISGKDIIARSDMMKVLRELVDFIRHNKAYSIIVSNGISQMLNEVNSIRNSLYLQRIEPYILGHDELVCLWNKRKARTDEFASRVVTISNDHFFNSNNGYKSLCERLSESVGAKIFDDEAIKELCQKIATAIYNEKWKLVKMGKNEEKIKKHLDPIIKNVIVDFLTTKILNWNGSINSGQDINFSNIFNPEMKLLKHKLEKEWESLYADDSEFSKSMKEYFDVPTSTKDFAMKEQKEGSAQNITIKQGSLAPYLLGDLMASIAAIVGVVMVLAMPTVVAVVSNPVGWAAGLVIGGGAAIYMAFKGEDILEEKFVKKVAPDLFAKLKENNVQGTFGNIINREMKDIINGYLRTLKVNNKLMDNNATIATSTPASEISSNCSDALEIIEEIDNQLSLYKNFINTQLSKS